MEKFPGYSGINSAISDLAAIISDKLAKADSQISELGVSCRPTTDSHQISYHVLAIALKAYSCKSFHLS
jgi:hypothetical protein